LVVNPAVKRKWIDALRSGTFKQIVGELFEEAKPGGKPGACLLGVLLDLAVQENIIRERESGLDLVTPGLTEVMEWSGLDAEDTTTIMELNDTYDVSFEAFASFLEAAPDEPGAFRSLLEDWYSRLSSADVYAEADVFVDLSDDEDDN
jgi:hypothetical protein